MASTCYPRYFTPRAGLSWNVVSVRLDGPDAATAIRRDGSQTHCNSAYSEAFVERAVEKEVFDEVSREVAIGLVRSIRYFRC